MRDPITLLETIGADASLIRASAADLGRWLECAELAPALRSAVLDGDVQTLRKLLRTPDTVCCLIEPGKEEEEEGDEEEESEEEESEEEDADEESADDDLHSRNRALHPLGDFA